MKQIIISEDKEKKLIKTILKEESNGWADKVSIVTDFLDKNFVKAVNSEIGEDGLPKNKGMVIMVDSYKQPLQYLSDTDLFYMVQDKFKNILPADDDSENPTHFNRDKFLKQIIIDWYHNKISQYGSLTQY